MTNPADQPPDPDADLDDDGKAQRDRLKRWVGDAFEERIKSLKEADDDAPPRTKPPKNAGGFSILSSLFGGGAPTGKE